MAANFDLNTAIGAVLSAGDPATELHNYITSGGGTWMDADSKELFEICAGIVGIGFGTREAVQCWINRAREQLNVADVELLA